MCVENDISYISVNQIKTMLPDPDTLSMNRKTVYVFPGEVAVSEKQ